MSTKRYKQPSENNRFQDIPPRFKRQKSFSSQSTMDSPIQSNHTSQKNKKHLGELPSGSGSAQKGSPFPREGRKIVKKLATQKAQQNAEKTLLEPSTQQLVLSPMENKLFSLVRNDEYENPQLSSCSQNNQFSTSCFPQPQCDPFTNNSNIHNHPRVPNQPDPYCWVENNQSVNQYNSPETRFSPSPSVSSHRSVNNGSPHANYSDPDIRTIEMLRELERVADQTDVGSEESSNDKNSLVSHHLRMLMCAVDRYTEGVEEEVLPQKSSQHISSPSQIQSKNVHQNQDFSDTDSAYSDDSFSPSKPVYHYPVSKTLNQPQINSWDPWTTPSFNALDVYSLSVSSPNANQNNNTHFVSHPSMFMYEMYPARDSF